ncbi:MAG TPA: hypothetical protein PLP31_03965 [Thermoanaerobaculaceae bacterium]|nr:hypothetical protein [Thermoanaerobaculaceae bacterium]
MDNETLMLAGVIVGPLLLIVLAFALWKQAEKKRRQALTETAALIGFSYEETSSSLPERFLHFEIFTKGHSKRATSILKGRTLQAEAWVLDYRYTTGGGKSSSTHVQTVCLLSSPDLALPHFTLRRELAFVDHLVEAFIGQDIDFEEDPEFSKKVALRGESVDAVRQLFRPEVRAHVQHYAERRFQLEGRDTTLLVDCNRLVKPTEIRDLLVELSTTVGILKEACRGRW